MCLLHQLLLKLNSTAVDSLFYFPLTSFFITRLWIYLFSHCADLIDFLANTLLLLFFSSSAPLSPCLLCRRDTPFLILAVAAGSLTRFKLEIPSPCPRPPPPSPQPPAHQVWIKTLPPSQFDYAGPLLFNLIHNVLQMAILNFLFVYAAADPSRLLAPSPLLLPLPLPLLLPLLLLLLLLFAEIESL